VVLGDRALELAGLEFEQLRRFELGDEHAQLAPARPPRTLLGLREAIPGAGEGEQVRAPTPSVGGEHWTHPSGAVAVGADDDVAGAHAVEHRTARVLGQALHRGAQVREGGSTPWHKLGPRWAARAD
jgi:hypothetical protein